MVAVNHLFDKKNSRRTFLRYLAASPLASINPGFSHDVNEEGEVILNAEDALDVFDFKATAKKILRGCAAHSKNQKFPHFCKHVLTKFWDN